MLYKKIESQTIASDIVSCEQELPGLRFSWISYGMKMVNEDGLKQPAPVPALILTIENREPTHSKPSSFETKKTVEFSELEHRTEFEIDRSPSKVCEPIIKLYLFKEPLQIKKNQFRDIVASDEIDLYGNVTPHPYLR